MASEQFIQKLKGMIRKPAKPVTIADVNAAVLECARKEYLRTLPKRDLRRG